MPLKLDSFPFSSIELEIVSTSKISARITLKLCSLGERGETGKFWFKGWRCVGCWNFLRKAALQSSFLCYPYKLGCEESLIGSLQDFGVDDPCPRLPEIWISICLLLLRRRAEGLIWMRQRAINPGSCLPQGQGKSIRTGQAGSRFPGLLWYIT